MIDFGRLRREITAAAVTAVNATLYAGEFAARRDVPVRKVFKGGKQTVRFKTADEIERDKDLRARLGLGAELLATPAALAAVRASGRNPKKSHVIKGEEFGFARTVSHPSSDPRRLTAGQTDMLGLEGIVDKSDLRHHLQSHGSGKTRAERGLTQSRSNRANTFLPFGEDVRVVKTGSPNRLRDESAERYLTTHGRYELRTGRSISQRTRQEAVLDIKAGKVSIREIHTVGVGQERLGGGLLHTIRVIKADASMFPVIEGWLVAGDEDHKYAKYQELGTRHNAAHPFLRPRLPEWKEELPVQLRRSLGRTGR